MTASCVHCGDDVDTSSRFVYREVIGWTQGGRATVTSQQPTGRYACDRCMAQLKAKLSIGQQGML